MSLSTHTFATDADLQRRVEHASATWVDEPSRHLLQDVTRHVDRLNAQIAELSTRLQQLSGESEASEPALKKRKLPQPISGFTNGSSSRIHAPLLASIKDVSFTIPVRKKCTLEVYASRTSEDGGVRVVNPSNGDVEAEVAVEELEQITVTPLPERASLTYTYCLLPKSATPLNPPAGIAFSATPALPPSSAVNITDPSISGSLSSYANFAPLLNDLLNIALAAHKKRVVDPNPDEFVSNIVQAHRKNEKSWCTKAWKGSKEGYVYPLSPGLLFGFKKPVLFLPFGAIESVSYTNVLQRTFNLVVTVFNGDGSTEEAEFSMLDQADFAPVDEWVKRHQLDDKSLATERRAKLYGVNKPKAERDADGDNGGQHAKGDDEETDLAQAERELQDREDEEEEDFDPGSEGDSDGSGSSSEEEDGGGDEDVEEDQEDEEELEQDEAEAEGDED